MNQKIVASTVLMLIAAGLVYVAPNAVAPTAQAAPIPDPCNALYRFYKATGLLSPGCEFDCWQLIPSTCYVVEVWCGGDCRVEETWCGFGPGEIVVLLESDCLCCNDLNIPCEQYTGSCP